MHFRCMAKSREIEMLYLKVMTAGENAGDDDSYALHCAVDIYYGGEDPSTVTWTAPPDEERGKNRTRGLYRGHFTAIWVMSEQGKTLDKIRGFTPEECQRWPAEVDHGAIPAADQLPPPSLAPQTTTLDTRFSPNS